MTDIIRNKSFFPKKSELEEKKLIAIKIEARKLFQDTIKRNNMIMCGIKNVFLLIILMLLNQSEFIRSKYFKFNNFNKLKKGKF
jgi:hypothetical protein